jgi:type II secretory pathway component PulM
MPTQLHRMQVLRAQAETLKGEARSQPERWREEFRESLEQLGQAQVQDAGDTQLVRLKACPPQALGRWLSELGPRWHLQVIQASLRKDEQGLWQGQLTLKP